MKFSISHIFSSASTFFSLFLHLILTLSLSFSSLFFSLRPSIVETEWREAGEDGSGTGNSQTGASSAGPATASPGGKTQPPAAQQRSKKAEKLI